MVGLRCFDKRKSKHLKLIGAIAQLGERLHGMQEVGGSIPPSSTIESKKNNIPQFNYNYNLWIEEIT